MFFAKAGEYEACGMFTIGHFILIVITIIGIIISLKKTVNKSKQEKMAKNALKVSTKDVENKIYEEIKSLIEGRKNV